MRGVGRAIRMYRRVGNLVRAKGVILAFHRVTNLERDPQLLSVTPERFDAQLRVLKRSARVCTVEELLESCEAGRLQDRSVAVTFDDGYADNLEIAAPILRGHNVPACIYVSTGFVDTNLELMWDALERIFLLPGELPPSLSIPQVGTWFVAPTIYTEIDASHHSSWNVTDGTFPTKRHQIYCDLHHHLKSVSHTTRQEVLSHLYTWAKLPSEADPKHRILCSEEISAVPDDDLISFGAHTVTHPQLSSLTLKQQRQELDESFQFLNSLRPSTRIGMSYPFGTLEDFTSQTAELAAQLGYTYALANIPRTTWNHADQFRIPRMLVRNWDEAEFTDQLEAMFTL